MNEKRTGLFENGLIWFGAGVSIAEILTGTYLAPLGMGKGLAAILIGHIIGCLMLFLAGVIGGRVRKSAMETVKMSFGQKGSILFAVLNVLQLVGWTAIMIYDGALAADGVMHTGRWIWCLVIGGWTLSDNAILTYGVNQGVFIPLEDYFEKYCPNISAILDLPGVREKMTAPDGHIYTIPYVCTDTTVGYSPYINTKWLENVGMSMPTTTDEFEAVLKAFKEQDANGNGDASDEIPFSTDPNNKHIEAMAGYFGLPMNKLGIAIQNEKVVYGGVSDTYREFLSWFHKLYAEGLVDVELYTQDSSTWEGKGNQDLYGVSIAYGSNEFTGIPAAEERGDFDSMPVLNTDKDGIWLRDTEGFSVYRTQAVITNKAEHPEIICRWFDNAFALENGIGCNRGPVGVIVNKEDDGYHAIDTTTLSEEDQEKYSWGNLWPQSLPKYLPVDFEFVEEHPMYDEKKATEEAYEANLTKEIIPSYWIDLDKIDTFSDTNTAIKDFFEQQQAQFVCGELDIDNDADWQAYVDGMYSLGLEDWVATQGIEEIAK